MKRSFPRSNAMNAPLTNEQSLFGRSSRPGVEFEKVTRVTKCSKCGKGGGTLKNIGTHDKPIYQHVGGC